MSDTSEGWTVVKRKRRNDATPEEHLKIACDFWASPGISRSTGNKKDIVQERIAANEYIEHDEQVLEMTQNEAFNEFKAKFSEIKMGQQMGQTILCCAGQTAGSQLLLLPNPHGDTYAFHDVYELPV